MKLVFTDAQAAQLAPHVTVGRALLGRVTREPYDPACPEVAGRLVMELGTVLESALPSLRAAIAKAGEPKKAKKKAGAK